MALALCIKTGMRKRGVGEGLRGIVTCACLCVCVCRGWIGVESMPAALPATSWSIWPPPEGEERVKERTNEGPGAVTVPRGVACRLQVATSHPRTCVCVFPSSTTKPLCLCSRPSTPSLYSPPSRTRRRCCRLCKSMTWLTGEEWEGGIC